MGAIPGSMGAIRESRGALRGGEGRPGELLGSVVIRAGEIKTAPGLRAEQLALPLLQTPAAVGAGAHHLVGRGVAEWSLVALWIGERFHGGICSPARAQIAYTSSRGEDHMPRITRVYTRTGDDGTTGLGGGQRVAKDSIRIETYGTVDELNSEIGVAIALGLSTRLAETLARVQNELFNVGSDLCILEEDKAKMPVPVVEERHVQALERLMDELSEELPYLDNFIVREDRPARRSSTWPAPSAAGRSAWPSRSRGRSPWDPS